MRAVVLFLSLVAIVGCGSVTPDPPGGIVPPGSDETDAGNPSNAGKVCPSDNARYPGDTAELQNDIYWQCSEPWINSGVISLYSGINCGATPTNFPKIDTFQILLDTPTATVDGLCNAQMNEFSVPDPITACVWQQILSKAVPYQEIVTK